MTIAKEDPKYAKLDFRMFNTVRQNEEKGNLEEEIKGGILLKKGVDYDTLLAGFSKHYYGFKKREKYGDDFIIFSCPTRFVTALSLHDEVQSVMGAYRTHLEGNSKKYRF